MIENDNGIYKGYKRVVGNTDYINEYMANINEDDWVVNEYIIIQNTDDNSEKEMRWDGSKFVALKLPPSKFIKAKNALQRCALDMLGNERIKVCAVLGTYGSGKTRLCLSMALRAVTQLGQQSSILGVRSPIGESDSEKIGYLPGDLYSKTNLFFLPLVQQLDGGIFELESLQQRGLIDTTIPYFMKGTTYNSILVCDEAEDLTERELRLVGTRVGEEGRIFFSGDYKQGVRDSTIRNPLCRMCNEFKGNPLFGCIVLEEDVRSETSKLFAHLFEE